MAQKKRGRALSEVLETFAADGLHADLDDLQRLRGNEIITFKGSEILDRDVSRLRVIIETRDALGASWTIPQLAFFLAWRGMPAVPPRLIAQYIESDIDRFLATQKRMLQRQPTGAALSVSLPPEERMAIIAVRKYARDLHLDRKQPEIANSLEAFTCWLTIFFGAIEYEKDLVQLEVYLRRGARLSSSDDSAAEHIYTEIRASFEQLIPWLRPKLSSNELAKTVRLSLQLAPENMARAAADASLLFELFNASLVDVPDLDTSQMSRTAQDDLRRWTSPMPGVIAAVALKLANEKRTALFFEKLRTRSVKNFREEVTQLYYDAVRRYVSQP